MRSEIFKLIIHQTSVACLVIEDITSKGDRDDGDFGCQQDDCLQHEEETVGRTA